MDNHLEVLVVDDDPLHSDVYQMWLSLSGATMRRVLDLNQLGHMAGTADVVLFNMGTAGSGCARLNLAHALEATRSIPFICFSSKAAPLDETFAVYKQRLLLTTYEKLKPILRKVLQALADGAHWASNLGETTRLGPCCDSAALIGRLSPRETEVLCLLGKGHGSPEVADILGKSVSTIETHIRNMRGKLKIMGMLELRYISMELARCQCCAVFSRGRDHHCPYSERTVGDCPVRCGSSSRVA